MAEKFSIIFLERLIGVNSLILSFVVTYLGIAFGLSLPQNSKSKS
jgi:hypothetical protein